MKLCKDCKHSRGNDRFMECHAPQNVDKTTYITHAAVLGEDIVDESTRLRWAYCNTQRTGGWLSNLITNSCGERARWFEPKEPA